MQQHCFLILLNPELEATLRGIKYICGFSSNPPSIILSSLSQPQRTLIQLIFRVY